MGKKNIFIGLSTLLLVLLLGLSTRTYASTNVTLGQFKNVLYNTMTNFGDHDNTLVSNLIENFDFTNINTALSYDYVYIMGEIITSNLPTSNSNVIYLTIYFTNNPRQSMYNYISCRGYYQIQYNGNTQTMSYGRLGGILGSETYISQNGYQETTVRYNDVDFYTSTNSSQVTVESGFHPSGIQYGSYQPSPSPTIRFEPFPTKISDVYVGQNYNLTAYGCNKNNTYVSMRFGDLIQPPSFLIEEINVTMSYYNRGQSKWIEKYLLIETGEDLVPSNYKSSIANFKWENYEDYTITFSAFINNEYVHDDCLYTFSFIGKDTSGTPFYIEQTFYIIGSNTIITDGTLDISFLETGDYSNEYANDLNELASKIDDQNDLINAVEQGNINSWLPGSGDWSALIGLVGSGDDIVNTANLWGFRNYTNSYWASLYEMMNATYTVLSQTGTVSLDVSFHGYNHAITSADIPAPPLPIKNTISLCLITFVMISIYKSFSKKIEKLKMIDTSVLKSEAHDDSDLM